MGSSCTLVLTQGTHVIDEASAEALEKALALRANFVDVQIDITGSGNVISHARLSMQHVIAVIRHPAALPAIDLTDDSNVYALRRR
jgi:hypothetical protein